MKEIWKKVTNFEKYSVSNLGNVRNDETGRLLKLHPNEKGYYYVRLYDGEKIKAFRIHRLVALAFIPNPNNYKEVNHIDECKQNNQAKNLEWCDRKYNVNFGSGKERMKETCRIKREERIKKEEEIKKLEKEHRRILSRLRELERRRKYYRRRKLLTL